MTRHHPWSQRRMGIRAGVPGPPDEHGDCPFGAAVARRRFSHCLSRRVANRCYVSHVFCKACAPTTSSVVNGSPWRAQVSNASASSHILPLGISRRRQDRCSSLGLCTVSPCAYWDPRSPGRSCRSASSHCTCAWGPTKPPTVASTLLM